MSHDGGGAVEPMSTIWAKDLAPSGRHPVLYVGTVSSRAIVVDWGGAEHNVRRVEV